MASKPFTNDNVSDAFWVKRSFRNDPRLRTWPESTVAGVYVRRLNKDALAEVEREFRQQLVVISYPNQIVTHIGSAVPERVFSKLRRKGIAANLVRLWETPAAPTVQEVGMTTVITIPTFANFKFPVDGSIMILRSTEQNLDEPDIIATVPAGTTQYVDEDIQSADAWHYGFRFVSSVGKQSPVGESSDIVEFL